MVMTALTALLRLDADQPFCRTMDCPLLVMILDYLIKVMQAEFLC